MKRESIPRGPLAPEELVFQNEIDRFSLAIDVINRVPALRVAGAHRKERPRDRQIEFRNYAHERGADMREEGWRRSAG